MCVCVLRSLAPHLLASRLLIISTECTSIVLAPISHLTHISSPSLCLSLSLSSTHSHTRSGDDLHARLFDLLTAADERKRLASQPPPAALGSPFRTPVLALRGIGLSRPQSIYPSDSISMIRSRSRTGGTDVDPGEGEVGAAGATYAAYEEETAGRDSEGVTVGPGVDLAATSQPSVSGWAPVRAIVWV